MKKNNRLFAILGAVLIVLSVVAYFTIPRQRQEMLEAEKIIEKFSIPENQPPDSILKNRLVRGRVFTVEKNILTLSAYINWPELRRVENLGFRLTPETQYLCWPTTMPGGAGAVKLEDSLFTLTDETKLMINGETYLTAEQAAEKLEKKPYVLVALQNTYSHRGDNKTFQVAIVGCQDD